MKTLTLTLTLTLTSCSLGVAYRAFPAGLPLVVLARICQPREVGLCDCRGGRVAPRPDGRRDAPRLRPPHQPLGHLISMPVLSAAAAKARKKAELGKRSDNHPKHKGVHRRRILRKFSPTERPTFTCVTPTDGRRRRPLSVRNFPDRARCPPKLPLLQVDAQQAGPVRCPVHNPHACSVLRGGP